MNDQEIFVHEGESVDVGPGDPSELDPVPVLPASDAYMRPEDGMYRFDVELLHADGLSVLASHQAMRGRICAVEFDGGSPAIQVGQAFDFRLVDLPDEKQALACTVEVLAALWEEHWHPSDEGKGMYAGPCMIVGVL